MANEASSTVFAGFWAMYMGQPSDKTFLSPRKNDNYHGISAPLGTQQFVDSWEWFSFEAQNGDNDVVKICCHGMDKSKYLHLASTTSNGIIVAAQSGSMNAITLTKVANDDGSFCLQEAGMFYLRYDASQNVFRLDGTTDNMVRLTPIKWANDPSSLGMVLPGEIALYSGQSQSGNVWVFCNDFYDLSLLTDPNDNRAEDKAQSFILGTETGATLYADRSDSGTHQDFGDSISNLDTTSIKNKKVSSLQLWPLASPQRSLQQGEMAVYRQANWQGPARLISSDSSSLPSGILSWRLGTDTQVQLYSGSNFSGTSQMIYEDVANVADAMRWGSASPQSCQLAPISDTVITRPFALQRTSATNTGYDGAYMIWTNDNEQPSPQTPNYLVQTQSAIPVTSSGLLLQTVSNPVLPSGTSIPPDTVAVNIIGTHDFPGWHLNHYETSQFAGNGILTGVPDPSHSDVFFMKNENDGSVSFSQISPAFGNQGAGNQAWLTIYSESPDPYTFIVNPTQTGRERFRFVELASSEAQVTSLLPGQIAFYEHANFWGQVWIFDTRCEAIKMPANVRIGSMRLGPHTGCTFYANAQMSGASFSLIEASSNISGLMDTSRFPNGIASLRAWKISDIESADFTASAVLMQDYVQSGSAAPTPYNAYRVVITPTAPIAINNTTVTAVPANLEIEIGAMTAVTLRMKGQISSIGLDQTVTASINSVGHLAFNISADSLAAPVLRVRTATMPENSYVLIFPDEQLHKSLSKLTAADLTNADRPLLTGDAVQHADGVAKAVANLAAATTSNYQTHSLKRVITDQLPTGYSRASMRLSPGTTANALGRMGRGIKPAGANVNWALDFSSGVASYNDDSDFIQTRGVVAQAMSPDCIANCQATSSSQWQTMCQSPMNISTIVVQSAQPIQRTSGRYIRSWFSDFFDKVIVTVHQMVQEAGEWVEQIVSFVVDSVQAIADLMTAVFNRVGKALSDVVDWLTALFSWNDINATKQVIASGINGSLTGLVSAMSDFKTLIDNDLASTRNTMNQYLDSLVPPEVATPSRQTAENDVGTVNGSDVQGQWLMSTTMDQPESLVLGFGGITVLQTDAEWADSWDTWCDNLFNNNDSLNSDAHNAFVAAKEQFLQAFNDPANLMNHLLAAVVDLVKGLANTAFDIATTLIDGILSFLITAIEKFQQILIAPVTIPVISSLYSSTISPGDSLTLLDLLALAIAAPITIAYKLANSNTAPFRVNRNASGAEQVEVHTPKVWGYLAGATAIVGGTIDTIADSLAVAKDLSSTLEIVVPTRYVPSIQAMAVIESIVAILALGTQMTYLMFLPPAPGSNQAERISNSFEVKPKGQEPTFTVNGVKVTVDTSEQWAAMSWCWRFGMVSLDIVGITASFLKSVYNKASAANPDAHAIGFNLFRHSGPDEPISAISSNLPKISRWIEMGGGIGWLMINGCRMGMEFDEIGRSGKSDEEKSSEKALAAVEFVATTCDVIPIILRPMLNFKSTLWVPPLLDLGFGFAAGGAVIDVVMHKPE